MPDLLEELEAAQRKDNEAFISHLKNHPKYRDTLGWSAVYISKEDIASAPDEDKDALRAMNEKYISFSREHSISVNQAARHKCKAGLDWVTRSNDGRHVHFVLDDLDMSTIVYKNYRDVDGGHSTIYPSDDPPGRAPGDFPSLQKYRPTTGSELRWIFRNRNFTWVAENVQFWHKLHPCPPPWISPPEWYSLWTHYRPGHFTSPNPFGPLQHFLQHFQKL